MKLSFFRAVCIITLITLLPKISVQAQAEYFDGPRTVYVSQEPINYYYNGASDQNGTWSINGTAAEIVLQNADMVSVRMLSFGSFYLGHSNSIDGFKEIFINVYNLPPQPATPFIVTSLTQCEEVTIEVNVEQKPSDVYWFWQTVPDGRSPSLGTNTQLEVTVSGMYYLQSRSTFDDNVWGETSTGIYVNVPARPVDGTITSDNPAICILPGQSSSFTISSTGGVGTPHYWASTNGGASWNVFADSHVGESSFSFTPSSAGTYRFLVRNYSPYCGFCTDPGNTCGPDSYVDVVVNDVPSTSGELYVVKNAADNNICVGSPVEISVQNSPGTQYYWISRLVNNSWESVEDASNFGNPFVYTFNSPGEWRIITRAENSCGLGEASNTTSFTVWEPPTNIPSIEPVEPICVGMRVMLTAAPSQDGTGVKWFAGPTGGAFLNAPPFSGRYQTVPIHFPTQYWAATNSTAGCAGPRVPVSIAIDQPAVDSDITANLTRICLGQSVTIQISGGTGVPHFYCSTTGGSTWNVFSDEHVGQTSFVHKPEYPGTYRYKVRNATGCGLCGELGDPCIYNKYVEVVVEGIPRAGYISGSRTVIIGNTYTYSIPEAAHAISYQWQILNGEIITGQNTPTVVVRFNSKVGQLSVTAISENCGSSFSTSLSIREGLNFIIDEKVLTKGNTDELAIDQLSKENKTKTTTYFDGLARPIQIVSWNLSPSGLDLVQPIVYDEFGREVRKYLPFTSDDNGSYSGKDGSYKENDDIVNVNGEYIGVAQSFYQTGSNVASDPHPSAKTIFEPSPLNRILEQGSPGLAWQPDNNNSYSSQDHTIKHAFESNGGGEVILWNYIPATSTTPMDVTNTGNFYDANELSKTRSKDEDHHEVIEYKDKNGRTVLKRVQAPNNEWADTYYVYDDVGNLVVVLPPEAVRALD